MIDLISPTRELIKEGKILRIAARDGDRYERYMFLVSQLLCSKIPHIRYDVLSRIRVMNHSWSATKQRLHPQSAAEISCHSVLSGDRIRQKWDIVWVSPQGHRSVSVSRHFLLQAPQCPCSLRKRFSRDHCCRRRSKPGCRIVGSHAR